MQQILDLHIHSKYSRACSKNLELGKIAEACITRGVDIVATGDFTHPKWFEHIKESMVEENDGIYKLRTLNPELRTRFVIGTELSCIKKHKDKTRRIHVCVFAPNIAVAEKFNNKLEIMGFNLRSDGRPILGLTVKQLLEIMLEVDKRMIMIPAHAWTPWFGIFGSKGGYNDLEEAFEELTPHIFAIETGLSSDPLMNWRLSKLDKIALVSNSDAHSLEKIGREANVLEFINEKEITYEGIMEVIKNSVNKNLGNLDYLSNLSSIKNNGTQIKQIGQINSNKFLYTIEFYPEEGKYHYDGHRDCNFVCAPEETKKLKGICPKCKKELVIGVMNRVAELADRSEEDVLRLRSGQAFKIPFKSLVPLPEIIADAYGCGVNTKRVREEYDNLIKKFGSEFDILLNVEVKKIIEASEKIIGEAVERVRNGKIYVKPGFDGEFGVVKVFSDQERVGTKQVGFDL